jgi:hypothetical protein
MNTLILAGLDVDGLGVGSHCPTQRLLVEMNSLILLVVMIWA